MYSSNLQQNRITTLLIFNIGGKTVFPCLKQGGQNKGYNQTLPSLKVVEFPMA